MFRSHTFRSQPTAEAEVIVGYNNAFDIEMLQAELARAGRPPLDFQGKQIVDAFRLWQQCEPRSLQHAHQRFVGNGFASAHSASADVAATGRVLAGMLRAFNLGGQDWTQIANVCDPGRASWVGPSRHLRFSDLPEVLAPGDLLVLNDTRVIPARLVGRKESGGRCELLLVADLGGAGDRWRAMGQSSKSLRAGSRLAFGCPIPRTAS